MDDWRLDPGDVLPGEDPDKVARARARFRPRDVRRVEDFERLYGLLYDEFFAAGELERREVLEAWQSRTVRRSTPPSTSRRHWYPRSFRQAASWASFGIMSVRKDWPPKPGCTVMTRTRSTWSSRCSTAPAGVPGLSTMPHWQPRLRMRASVAAWS